jgi:hypothetical protein
MCDVSKRGRKTALTPKAKAIILEILSDGCSRNTAAAVVGVSTPTIANEAARDPEFFNALKKAEGDCEWYHVKRIKAGKPGWQSSAWSASGGASTPGVTRRRPSRSSGTSPSGSAAVC